ncbi:hypothetical protein QWY85_05550 [Neolewinella lacunae]|uniref:Uncharacterized protein n=1 Tax=Neolewinella lacunae TaxID=1517758 RepID=A0A923PLZ8_9BACT|nr:hypothetical protein [Neolewinella lacunae]MBC6995166.1 hypothetical protein [Neolewinella lacunae]MDN3634116.1 hypothetical protein [Neolewinella lacunae]
MSYQSKVIYISLGIFLVLTILSYAADYGNQGSNNYAGLGYMLLMMCAIIAEVVVLFLIGIVMRLTHRPTPGIKPGDPEILDDQRQPQVLDNKQKAKAYFLAMGLVLLVGVSLCFGGVSLMEVF